MRSDRLIVLKFGGSVLKDEATLRLAVHEIYRWRRDGWRVVAVVSALAGRTDTLLRLAQVTAAGHGSARGDADPNAVASLIATGELQSAGLLALHLDRAGVRASVLWPSSFGLVADGSPLDATPVALDRAILRGAIRRHGVVVVPGFAAEDREGRPVVLGRGGSDLTALFVAHALGADRCRLVKDVDGLYEDDPADRPLPGLAPRRYSEATFADALATDGSIVQHKAVRFAASHGFAFELGSLSSTCVTRVGADRSTFAPGDRPRRLRVALLGLGTVGGGVFQLLRQLPAQFEVTVAAVRDPTKPRALGEEPPALTSDVMEAVAGADVVVELIGGIEPARSAVAAALAGGAHVVTANKALVAEHGQALEALATARGRSLLYSASVGGSMPILEAIAARPAGVRSIRAVLNGTTNFVLDQVSTGASFAEAVVTAQRAGFAEADPTRDLHGLDAADKLCVLAGRLGASLRPEDVERDELSEATVTAALAAASSNCGPLRHVATLSLAGGRPRAEVRLLQVGKGDPLARARKVGNRAVLEWEDGSTQVVSGKGAGRWPTAEAVVADLLAIFRGAPARETALESQAVAAVTA